MEELEKELTNASGEGEVELVDPVAAINELKKTTVSKDRYNKLAEKYNEMTKAILNGDVLSAESVPAKQPVDINKLRNELYGSDSCLNNLQYVQKSLELRNALIKAGEKDPFLPYGKQIKPDDNDYIKAENAAKIFQECIDFAEGDSELFTNELMRRTVDSSPMGARKNAKKR